MGGSPDLPPGTAWPAHDQSLSFIGQIDLGDVRFSTVPSELPQGGLLSFFYVADQSVWGFDPKDRGAWRVLFTPAGETLQTITLPDSIPEEARYHPISLRGREELTYPPVDSSDLDQLGLTRDEVDAYNDVLFGAGDLRFAESTARFGDVPEGDETAHRVLGHPDPIQGDMQLECQLASNGIYVGGPDGYTDPRVPSLKSGATDWRLLFQVDSEDAAGMMWGDVGRLYYWIRDADLKSSKFDDGWMILQCG